jgi:hypothetical protein
MVLAAHIRLSIALACWLIWIASATAQEALRYKFTAGEELRYTRSQERLTESQQNGERRRETLLRVIELKLVVEKVPTEGPATIVLSIERIRYRKHGPAGEVAYDSADSSTASKLAPSLKRLL